MKNNYFISSKLSKLHWINNRSNKFSYLIITGDKFYGQSIIVDYNDSFVLQAISQSLQNLCYNYNCRAFLRLAFGLKAFVTHSF